MCCDNALLQLYSQSLVRCKRCIESQMPMASWTLGSTVMSIRLSPRGWPSHPNTVERGHELGGFCHLNLCRTISCCASDLFHPCLRRPCLPSCSFWGQSCWSCSSASDGYSHEHFAQSWNSASGHVMESFELRSVLESPAEEG